MGPTFKMSLLVFVATALILAVGQLALQRSQETLFGTIEEGAASRAGDLMDQVDRIMDLRIRQWQAYAESDLVQQALERSNRHFSEMPSREATLVERESAWRVQAGLGGSEFSKEIAKGRLTRDLVRQLEAISEQASDDIFGRVLITNRYGVNIAETSLASDYRQDDEDWWQMAAQDGVYIDSLKVDEVSGLSSIEICLRIENADGGLAGVLMTSLNLEPLFDIVDAAARPETLTGEPIVAILNAKYLVIHSSHGEDEPLSSGLHYVDGAVLDPEMATVKLERIDPRAGSRRLSAYARSQGHLGQDGLGWILLLEYDADRVLAATGGLRDGILHAALLAAIALIMFSLPISISLSRETRRRRNLEQSLSNANQARVDFVVTSSRELRLPMASISKTIQELEDTTLDERQSRSVELLHANARAMGLILNDALDLSRFEADRSPVVIEPFDLRACLEEIHPIGRAAAHAKDLSLSLDLPTDLPDQIRGDACLIRQIYLQLVGNAVRFSEEGRIEIRLRLDFTNTAEPWLDLWVSDTGVGIARSEFESIFKPDDRAGSLVSTQHGGVGDGLAVVKNWIEVLGGAIDVKSQRDVGSTFHVRIPVDRVEEDDTFQREGPAQIAERIGSVEGVRVLVVEDNAAVRRVLLRALEKLGCETEVCVNGAEAVERIRDEEFDVVLMDCNMPVMDGYEAAKQIREIDLDYYLPIIAITAQPSDVDRQKCLAAGMDEILSKPIGLVQLCEMVVHWALKNCDRDAAVADDVPTVIAARPESSDPT